ncbi:MULTISPECIES: hypothetical protein [unclassified Streptomyces]|uniref:hypothetical protein n=1 Tax=unclassified Streptomyces TaxID=2593676 RepID=UPI00331EEE52
MNGAEAGSSARTTRLLLLVADPDLPSEIARDLAEDLPAQLDSLTEGGIHWVVKTVTADLVADEQVDVADMADLVSAFLTDEDWDIGIFLTDLPRRARFHPVSAEVSTDRGVALLSVPALGPWRLRRRVEQGVLAVASRLVEEAEESRRPRVIGRSARQARGAGPGPPGPDRYVVPGLHGHFRLVAGMVRANRPWRLFTSLSRALAGVFATAAVSFLNNVTWQVAVSLDVWQQLVVTVACAAALTAWVIVDHRLWEKGGALPGHGGWLYPYNLVTLITVALGVLTLYVLLFVTMVAVSFLTLDRQVFSQSLGGGTVETGDYFYLAWFISSISMVGGAFGTGLEQDEAVRYAAYGRRHRDRQQRMADDRTGSDADPRPDS